MNRGVVAKLWQQITNESPTPCLTESGQLHDREHGHDRLPQPGFVGHRYREGGLLIFGLNPAAGGNGLTSNDMTQYELLRKLRNASENEVVGAFDALMCHLEQIMPDWRIIENNGINSIFKEHGITFSDVSYLNLCKWRTKSSSLSVCVKRESWLITRNQFRNLNPSRVIVLGKVLWEWCYRQKIVSTGDAFIPRLHGDIKLAPEAIEIVDALKRTPLLPISAPSLRW